LPSIEASDRRRSARVAKAEAATSASLEAFSTPNLAQFGFSPFLESLIMNSRDSDRRTRSGIRSFRPATDRVPTKAKRLSAKSKNKEVDSDGTDDQLKRE
jgi:hypothetical protein